MKQINTILKYLPIIGLVILILLCLKQCSNISDLARKNAELQHSEQLAWGNIQVLKDTIKYWKDDDGNSKSQISILSGNKKMLDENFKELTDKYNNVVGEEKKETEMIAYLASQIKIQQTAIAELKAQGSKEPGSKIINDSTIGIDISQQYDSANYYSVTGNVVTSIKGDKITAGKIDLTTKVGLGIELAISRDKKTQVAKITSKTAFPAKINLGGITQIETELNKKPSGYLGLSIFGGYGATLEKTPTIHPMIGVGVYYAPRWLTIKLRNR